MCSTKFSRPRRDAKAAKRLLIRLLRKQSGRPRRIVTDKLGSYAAAGRSVMPEVEWKSATSAAI
jgi:putative transposase